MDYVVLVAAEEDSSSSEISRPRTANAWPREISFQPDIGAYRMPIAARLASVMPEQICAEEAAATSKDV